MSFSNNDQIVGLLSEYEDILLGKRKSLSYWYFNGSPEHDEILALHAFRYAFEKLLHWTPEMVYECHDYSMLYKMHLSHLYKFKIKPKKESSMNSATTFQYLARKLYPEIFKNTRRDEVLKVYKDVLDQKLKKIPKNMFEGNDGLINIALCLQYIISEKMLFKSVDEMYERFSDMNILKTLAEYKLLGASKHFFETPVDFLHFSLPLKYRDEQLHLYAKRVFCQNRIKTHYGNKIVQDYKEYLKGNRTTDPFHDSLGTPVLETVNAAFTYFVNVLLPNDKELCKMHNNFSERVDFYDLFFDENIDYILDKYGLRTIMTEISPNLIEAFNSLLTPEERDVSYFVFVKDMYEVNEDYKPLPPIARKYLAALAGYHEIDDVITNEDEFMICKVLIKRHLLPEDEKYKRYPFARLMKNRGFLEKYKLLGHIEKSRR